MNEELPKPIHPWRQALNNRLKLKLARKEAKRRYEKTSPIRNDEYRTLRKNGTDRKLKRMKLNIPIDLPVMKPWDYAKGRVK